MTGQRAPFTIGGNSVAPGQRRTVDLRISKLSDHTPVNMSVHVVHGRRPGPVMFVSAAIHGDEVIGAEIVRRLLRAKPIDHLAGTLLAVPIVNTFGFLNQSRYLPDRRDLNRCFPGHPDGSLAARLAYHFMDDVVKRSDVGIDLHSAAIQRTNLPQIRLTPGVPRLEELGRAFGAPVMVTSKLREGSLRAAGQDAGVDILLYEAGEGLRFDEYAARTGVSGILRVMQSLGMLGARGVPKLRGESLLCRNTAWARAPSGGLLRAWKGTGDVVEKGAVMGVISDPFGENEAEVRAESDGIVIGRTNLPVVNEGDALFHVAAMPQTARAEAAMERHADMTEAERLFDEDEII
ncbi:succinylglutamate desuccinylase [Aquicoccus sp. SCR17]|nr:succinylglutamate desuccinylase [Carideicomes alvinocaridis]